VVAEERCEGVEGPDRVFRFEFQGVLGTVVDVRIETDEEVRARALLH
jgi:hypothetical protein